VGAALTRRDRSDGTVALSIGVMASSARRAAVCEQGERCATVGGVASYALNEAAVDHARTLIEGKQYVLDSDWGVVQPDASVENAYLERHDWDAYAAWHLGLTEGATEQTKARYAFVFGDFRRVHRTGLIACVYRASQWRHKDVELAAHDLLQCLDRVSG
jgi:xanthine/CO dehydrogenase XdhC/CoxF family maturation factor